LRARRRVASGGLRRKGLRRGAESRCTRVAKSSRFVEPESYERESREPKPGYGKPDRLALKVRGTGSWPVTVDGLAENFSSTARIAPPPLGSETCGNPGYGAGGVCPLWSQRDTLGVADGDETAH